MLNDKQKIEELRKALVEMTELLQDYAAKNLEGGPEDLPEWIGGLGFEFGKVSYAMDGTEAKVTLTILPEELAKLPKWERDMPDYPIPFMVRGYEYRVSKADLGRTATIGGTTYKFLGIATKNRKYPWICSTDEGTVKITNESMAVIVRAWREQVRES